MSYGIKGVSFDGLHTGQMNIYLAKTDVGAPVPKRYTVSIPGGHGSIDLTDYFGETKFENRTISFTFTLPQRPSEGLMNVYQEMLARLNGKYFESIILDDDNTYHYSGRVTVGNLQRGKLNKVVVTCDCLPFKFGNAERMLGVTLQACHIPYETFGDVNNDGEVTSSDRTRTLELIGRRSFESQEAFRADFDMDGVVTYEDYQAIGDYLTEYPSGGLTFAQYMTSKNILLPSWQTSVDFGSYPTKVKFRKNVVPGDNIRMWELRIDNIPQYIGAAETYSIDLSGEHKIMLRSCGSVSNTGTINISYHTSQL